MAKKVAVITGAAGAIGSAVAARLAKDGFTIVALTRAECDFADPRAISNAIRDVHERYGRIDVGIHAAWPGIARKKLLDTTEKEFDRQLAEGARGSFIFFQELGNIMRAQKNGALIGITTAALRSEEYPGAMGAYIPAKYALHGMLQIFAHELAPFGVAVHEIAPPFMPVGMNKDLPSRLFELIEEKNGPPPTPEELAEQISTLIRQK